MYEKLVEALTQNSLLKGIKQASPMAQTSCLEGHHSCESVCPKDVGFLLLRDDALVSVACRT